MKQILFVQGGGKDVHEQWDNKLVENLRRELGPDYEVRYPLMPNEADPQAAAWGVAIATEIAALQSGAIVVGHSIGGTILINVLAEGAPAVELGAIVLIAAPFVGDGGWKNDDIEPRSDLGAHLPSGVPVLLYHGDKDTTAPVAHLALYAVAIPQARVRQLANRDHQLNNDLSEVASDIRELNRTPGHDEASSVEHDSIAEEFRIPLGDKVALLQYRRSARGMNLFHTEVPIAHRRQGIAHRLTRAALEFAKEHGFRVIPTCPFVADFIRRHPEYHALVDDVG